MIKKTKTEEKSRYINKVTEALKNKVRDLVLSEDLITSDKNKKIRVSVPYIIEPYFKPTTKGKGGAGGEGEGQGSGEGGKGEDSEHFYVEFTPEELAEFVFSILNLPNLKPKEGPITKEYYEIEGISKSGPKSRIHRKRTFLEIVKKGFIDFLRYKDIRIKEKEQLSATVYFARDYSGSIGEYERFKIKSVSWWIYLFLKRSYPDLTVKFLVHDTKAKFVDEHDFFHLDSGGGTHCSSAFELINENIRKSSNQEDDNFYVFYFSDGENFIDDMQNFKDKVQETLKLVNFLVYGEVLVKYYDSGRYTAVMSFMRQLENEFNHLKARHLTDPLDFISEIFS